MNTGQEAPRTSKTHRPFLQFIDVMTSRAHDVMDVTILNCHLLFIF